MKLFRVVAKCGHVGRNYYVLKEFAIKAANGKDAAKIAREMPRVKHHHKDAIRSVTEITIEEYYSLLKLNSEDPYFSCTSIQEQRLYEEVVYPEEFEDVKEPETSSKIIYYGKQLLRNPKRYMRNIYMMERYAI